ncbi:4'-phosphopantetheinyl transferase family protein [Streptomyces sp. NBC_01244]|uniref:4'-phosphopantetheinyl transferase family protein n=1 Tax=Streptomyces sp. NBC_01244 TaxID=2903797 RepID=UPI002E11C3D5|nr:4'-phosphopantetheinyl transferase superfamily protein [Streptomyces sp. NBC_01244]
MSLVITMPRLKEGPDSPPTPQPDLWLIKVPDGMGADRFDQSVLDPGERERGASFDRPEHASLYVASHVALRMIIGGYLNVPPREVGFVREPCPGCGEAHGRPAVAVGETDPALHFSLSHSDGTALVAVASAPVGVDVQGLPRSDTVTTCLPSLHPAEALELTNVPHEARREAFCRIWVRKEAYLKGIGTGLSRDPSLDYLGAEIRRRPAGWTITDVPCGPSHRGAVAVLGNTGNTGNTGNGPTLRTVSIGSLGVT